MLLECSEIAQSKYVYIEYIRQLNWLNDTIRNMQI